MQEMTEAKARKRAQWRQRLERFAACGLPAKEFCQTESISLASLYRWQKELGAVDGTPSAPVGFIDAGALRIEGRQPHDGKRSASGVVAIGYLDDPEVPIDTNHLERALRVIPMGRRNWNFCWTELGARQVGIVQSLLVTCRLHKADPYEYLVDVLQHIDRHPASQAEQLTPRVWKTLFAANPLRSDLYQHDERKSRQ